KLGNQGGDVGPDLSTIGGKFGRPHLIESVLEPSAQLVEGFRSSLIATLDGRVETGIVKRESATDLTLVGPDGKERTVARADIEDRKEDAASLMPAGLIDVLSPAQFADLIAFL